jgi:hypothetical protein
MMTRHHRTYCANCIGAGIKRTGLNVLAVLCRGPAVLVRKSWRALSPELRHPRFDHFKVPVQVILGDLAGGRTG